VGLECQDLPALFDIYLKNHYSVQELSPLVKSRTVSQFIKMIDGSKTTLLESDVKAMESDIATLFETMRSGNCTPLERAQIKWLERSKESEDFARKFLDDKYKLDENVEFVLDPQKRSYPKSNDEKFEYQKKMMHFNMSNYLLADTKLPDARKQLVHRYELATKRVGERKKDMINTFASAFSLALDPHSSFMSRDSLEDFQIQMRLSLEGIGAALSSEDGYTIVEEIIPGGSAARSKLVRPRDKIIAVQQEGQKPVNVIDMDLQDVVKLIRGKKGTKVTLTILRQSDQLERLEVTLVRDKINMQDQAAKLTYLNRKVGPRVAKIGVITLPSFYGDGRSGQRSSYEDVRKLVIEARKNKVEGLVINLFRNGGGLLDDAVKMAGLFIRKGGVVATQNTQRKVEVLSDRDEETLYNGPLVLLTSRLSASASEILAGALKDYQRAIVVGSDHTFGKGSVQILHSLPGDLGAMKVTTGMYFLPGGSTSQHKGVSADVVIPTPYSKDEVGEKTLDYSLEPRTISSFLSSEANATDPGSRYTPVSASLIKSLSERSKQRVSKDKKFIEIFKESEEYERNKGIVKLAELRKRSAQDLKKKEPKKSSADRLTEADAPYVEEAASILGDALELM
jgi:carboxyl-terminal processing protease